MANFTKKALMASFSKLLNEKPFDKITVQDIVDDCGVNRNTFYYHFQDIYMLLECLLQQECQKVEDALDNDLTWLECFEIGFSFVFFNKTAVYHLYQSMNRETLEYFLGQVIENILKKYIDIHFADVHISDERKKFIIKFYKYGITGICLEGIASELSEIYIQKQYIQDIEKSFKRSLFNSMQE